MTAPPAIAFARSSLLAVLVCIALVNACGSDPAPPPTAEAPTVPPTAKSTTTNEPATTTTSPQTPEQQVEAAIIDAESHFWLALQRPSEGSIHLSQWFSGEALAGVKAAVSSLAEQGLASDPDGPRPTISVDSVVANATSAKAIVCVVDPQVIRAADGSVSNDAVRSRRYEFAVARETTWKVARMTVLNDWSDYGGCDR